MKDKKVFKELFKEGDKVKIKSFKQMCEENPLDYTDSQVFTCITFRPEMRKWCGRLATIIKKTGFNTYKLDLKNSEGWYFSSDMLINKNK